LIADDLTKDVDFDDVMFVGLALHLNCRLWTGDKTLVNALNPKGYKRIISTPEMIEKLKKIDPFIEGCHPRLKVSWLFSGTSDAVGFAVMSFSLGGAVYYPRMERSK